MKKLLSKHLAIASTVAILLGNTIFPSRLIAPTSDGYDNTMYIASSPSIESILKAENTTIIIDPGHDNRFLGRHINGQKEELLNLKFAKKMEESFKALGGNVYMTRTSGTRLNVNNLNLDDKKEVNVKDELVARANYIKNIPSDFVIIVHQNAYLTSKASATATTEFNGANGTELYIYGTKNEKQLDDGKLNYTKLENCKIYSRPSMPVAKKLGQYLSEQGIKVSVKGSDMKILEMNSDKVVLYLETGYMTNKSDLKNITNSEWQNNFVTLLTDFFKENISYIKKVNEDYALTKEVFYLPKPAQEKDSTNLEKMLNAIYRKI